MENIGQKKKPCEEKKIFVPKMASENALKNVVITYKSRILKFKIQQKRCKMIHLNVPNFLYIYEKWLFEWKNSQKLN